MFQIKNYINGEFLEPNSGEYLDNFNPAEGVVYSLIPDSDSSDVAKAVEAAKAAFPTWSALDKGRAFSTYAQRFEKNCGEIG